MVGRDTRTYSTLHEYHKREIFDQGNSVRVFDVDYLDIVYSSIRNRKEELSFDLNGCRGTLELPHQITSQLSEYGCE